MEQESFFKEKRARLLQDLVEKIKDSIKRNKIKGELSSKTFIYQRLADYTYYSEVSIRKFLTGMVPKDLSGFTSGVISYCKFVGISDEVVEEFVKEYTEATNTIILEKSSLIQTKHNLPPVDLSTIVVPKKLEDFLNGFLKENISLAYIFGYKLSGKTKSVMAYIHSLIRKNLYENIVYVDIRQNQNQLSFFMDTILSFLEMEFLTEEKKKEECLQFLKKGHSIFVLDFNNVVIEDSMLEWIKEISPHTKIIFLTSDNFKHYEERLSSYTKVFCTNDFISKEEFKRIVENRKKLTSILQKDEFMSKLYELTGGVPYFALSMIRKIEEEMEVGLSLDEAILKYSGEDTSFYDSFAEKIISDSWNRLDSLAKKILIICSKFRHSISLKLIAFLCSQNREREEWRNSLRMCYDDNLLTSILLKNPRVDMNNMIKTLVQSYEEKEEFDYQEFLNRLSTYYIELATSIGECYNDLDKLKLLDDLDEWDLVQEVLVYLEENDRKTEYIKIVKELKYYLYVRGIWQTGEDSLHLKRANMAKELGLTDDYVEALCDYINICSKSKNDGESFAYLAVVEKAVKNNPSICPRVMCLYYHVKALYLYHCEKDYQACYEIWKYNESHYRNEVSQYRRLVNELWLTRSYIKIEKDRNKIMTILEEKIRKMEKENFIRAQLDYELLLIGVFNEQIESFEKSTDMIERISKELRKCEMLLRTKSTKDIRNEAQFFSYQAILFTYLGDDSKREEALEKAIEKYHQMNDKNDIVELQKKIFHIEGK